MINVRDQQVLLKNKIKLLHMVHPNLSVFDTQLKAQHGLLEKAEILLMFIICEGKFTHASHHSKLY